MLTSWLEQYGSGTGPDVQEGKCGLCGVGIFIIPLCRPLVIRWCIEVSWVFAAEQDYVQRW